MKMFCAIITTTKGNKTLSYYCHSNMTLERAVAWAEMEVERTDEYSHLSDVYDIYDPGVCMSGMGKITAVGD